MSTVDPVAAEFEAQRARLTGLAYRMLGSVADAEDAVQEAWLRWREVSRESVREPRAFLWQTVTRLCLDRLKSARVQREHYVGPWLPEPLVEQAQWTEPGPEAAAELASDLSFAFMLTLERLSPLERAAFLLHDIFDADFAEVAAALGRSEAACRQLASRARAQVRQDRPRAFAVSQAQGAALAAAFVAALAGGDGAALKQLLVQHVQLLSDGGGRVAAVGIPLAGRERVLKVMLGLWRKHPLPAGSQFEPARVNGLPGVVIRAADGRPIQTVAIQADAQGGGIAAIYIVRNPEKLQRLRRP